MKVGDLVELSAKGKGLKYCKEFVGLVGLVSGLDTAINSDKEVKWFYIDWCGGKKNSPHLRTDLKFVSRK
tara:strand:+ start:264 stop:473 length:210 start_codon:yes stop_codon:yes gene_type:complete